FVSGRALSPSPDRKVPSLPADRAPTGRHVRRGRRMEPILNWHEASVMVTGGTGSFGNKFVEIMLQKYDPKRLVIFSRDELKQSEMSARFSDPSLRFFVGDVRDRERLERAMHGVDVVFHAAALKQIPSCE